MREINVEQITQAVKALCIKANKVLPCSLTKLIESSEKNEESPIGQEIFHDLCENLNAAKELDVPICQDTGMAVVFIEIGQEVMLAGGSLEKAINDGVSQGYTQGLLRCSIVEDPLNRVNTGDNTPAVIHTKIVDGDKISLTVAPKGFGSENMSAMKMFTPSATSEDIIDFVVQCVDDAGSNPCPPIVVGVGIGGDFELCAYLSKKALCRDVLSTNENKFYAELENKMLTKINELGIGPQGFGGTVTALAVNIETFSTHIAGLPVAVNIGCHVTRHAKLII
jgi:fumarate hydratase subunit alpha